MELENYFMTRMKKYVKNFFGSYFHAIKEFKLFLINKLIQLLLAILTSQLFKSIFITHSSRNFFIIDLYHGCSHLIFDVGNIHENIIKGLSKYTCQLSIYQNINNKKTFQGKMNFSYDYNVVQLCVIIIQ